MIDKNMYYIEEYATGKKIGKHGFKTEKEAEQYKRAYLNMMWKEKQIHNNLLVVVRGSKTDYGQLTVNALKRMK